MYELTFVVLLKIEEFGASNPLTSLQPSLHGIDPDDAFSSVPYEKGYAFLYYIESLVGGPGMIVSFFTCLNCTSS